MLYPNLARCRSGSLASAAPQHSSSLDHEAPLCPQQTVLSGDVTPTACHRPGHRQDIPVYDTWVGNDAHGGGPHLCRAPEDHPLVEVWLGTLLPPSKLTGGLTSAAVGTDDW